MKFNNYSVKVTPSNEVVINRKSFNRKTAETLRQELRDNTLAIDTRAGVIALPTDADEKTRKKYVTVAELWARGIWKELKRRPLLRMGATLGICALFMVNPCFAASTGTQAIQPLIHLIQQLVDGVQLIGFYLGMAMALFETIKSFMEGDPRRIPGVVTKYAIGIALLYAVPSILVAIKDAFTSASVTVG